MADKHLIGHRLDAFSIEVEKGRLRFFAKAIGETDPIYTDEDAARAAGHRNLPVPPTFFKCLESEGRDLQQLLELFDFDLRRLLHAEQGFDYHNMAYAGDVLTYESHVADIYEKKGGALQFAVIVARVTNQHGEHIADVRTSLVQR
ncbi:MaoC family dehydratase N-terminal domain-containing protein [Pseudomonas sp. NPDC089996]|uniref:MaoC family dehydratase N-terminal domain-containing protein n=1 Tax=Pseudomonas sp. NPDC089996 TaxID=3364474 RepID=UPI00380AD21F